MKSATAIVAILGLVGTCAAQAAPSPTESVGCVAHGDHWDCDGPAAISEDIGVTETSASTVEEDLEHDEDHDEEHDDEEHEEEEHDEEHDEEHEDEEHDHESSEGAVAPSPTESTGCSLHGDHWHCDSPATATDSGATGSTTDSSAPAATTEAEADADVTTEEEEGTGGFVTASAARFAAGITLPLAGFLALVFAA